MPKWIKLHINHRTRVVITERAYLAVDVINSNLSVATFGHCITAMLIVGKAEPF